MTAIDRHTSTVTSSTVNGADFRHWCAIKYAMCVCIARKHTFLGSSSSSVVDVDGFGSSMVVVVVVVDGFGSSTVDGFGSSTVDGFGSSTVDVD